MSPKTNAERAMEEYEQFDRMLTERQQIGRIAAIMDAAERRGAEAERERCAGIAENYGDDERVEVMPRWIATAIRETP